MHATELIQALKDCRPEVAARAFRCGLAPALVGGNCLAWQRTTPDGLLIQIGTVDLGLDCGAGADEWIVCLWDTAGNSIAPHDGMPWADATEAVEVLVGVGPSHWADYARNPENGCLFDAA